MTNKQPTGIEEIEKLAKLMHDTYEDKAREFGWSTQKKTRVAFKDLPESNKRTMLAVAEVVYETTRREAVEKIEQKIEPALTDFTNAGHTFIKNGKVKIGTEIIKNIGFIRSVLLEVKGNHNENKS